MRAPRTSFKRTDSRMNIDWRTTKDQDYNMDRGASWIQWVQPMEPRGHMIQYSQLRLLESKRFRCLNPLNSGLPVHIVIMIFCCPPINIFLANSFKFYAITALYFTYNILKLKGRSHQKPLRTGAPRTSFKRPDSRMNIDWRTTKDQDYNMDRGPAEFSGFSQRNLVDPWFNTLC